MKSLFPAFRALGQAIVADSSVGQWDDDMNRQSVDGAFLVAESVRNPALRDFIIEACNTHNEVTVDAARLLKARADIAEREFAAVKPETAASAEAAEPVFGWYAGLSLEALSVGPLPSFTDALAAAKIEHGADKTIFLIEAAPIKPTISPFTDVDITKLLSDIEIDNAGHERGNGVLPPLREHHLSDLADRLNGTVVEWMAAHEITIISAGLDKPRNAVAVLPHDVASLVSGKATPGSLDAVVSEKGREPLSPIAVDPERHSWKPRSKMALTGNCDDCGANYCHCIAERQPAPHTGDMVAMLDKIGGES